MKVTLNGIEVKLGSMVRFISDENIKGDYIVDEKDRNIWQNVNIELNLPRKTINKK